MIFLVQARCLRIVRCLVDSARDTSPLSDRLKTNLRLTEAPEQIAEMLCTFTGAHQQQLAFAALAALASCAPTPCLPFST